MLLYNLLGSTRNERACACAEGTAICPIVQGVVLGAFAGSTCDTIRASLVAATCDDCGLDKCDEGGDGGDGDDSDGTFEFRSPSVVNDAWSLHDFTPDIMQWCLLYFLLLIALRDDQNTGAWSGTRASRTSAWRSA